MKFIRVLAVIAAAVSLGACAVPHKQGSITTLEHAGEHAKIVLMPVDVELSEVQASGQLEPKADWTESAQQFLVAGLHGENQAQGLSLLNYDDKAAPTELRDRLNQIQKLHGAVGKAILIHHYVQQLQLPTKKGQFDWTLGPSVQALHEQSGADYALFVYIRDSYTSAGRVAVQILAAIAHVSLQGGQQLGFVSLVDLKTGNIVWYNLLARNTGDLRTADAAKEVAKTLLTGFPK
jgi:hypothetical protein